jgi:hypothetical protein
VLGFSEQAHGWAKKLIPTSEKGLCKGLKGQLTSGDYLRVCRRDVKGADLHSFIDPSTGPLDLTLLA